MRAMNNTQDDLAVRTAYHDHLHSIYAGVPTSWGGHFTLAMRTFHECASNLTVYVLKFDWRRAFGAESEIDLFSRTNFKGNTR